jgi:carbon dioxide concentrating mechanism protein CcmN
MPPSPHQLIPITTDQSFRAGDVVVGEGGAIAPGVLLQADVGCQVVISDGVCVGLGCVIHARSGVIRIGHGVNLGAGVLIVGAGEIGDRSLIGSGTTIFNRSVPADSMIAPNSLWVESIVLLDPGVVETPVRGEDTATPVQTAVQTPVQTAASTTANPSTTVPEPDPWADAKTNFTSTFRGPKANPTPPSSPTPGVGTPVTATYVYPDSSTLPKHPWDSIPAVPPPPATAPINSSSPASSPSAPKAYNSYPNPDGDLSPEEMQQTPGKNGIDGTGGTGGAPALPGALVPKSLRPIYGQAYVNQILGKMGGNPR